jgi:hypothetical protein
MPTVLAHPFICRCLNRWCGVIVGFTEGDVHQHSYPLPDASIECPSCKSSINFGDFTDTVLKPYRANNPGFVDIPRRPPKE